MTSRKIIYGFFLLFLVFLVSGCSLRFSSDQDRDLGGVFLSEDQGRKWRHAVAVPTVGDRREHIGNIAVNKMTRDPNDPQAVYLASLERGLYYTYDISEGWRKAEGLPNATIDAVRVDAQSKCIIYASSGNTVYKSTDCNRSWEPVYYDDERRAKINDIVVDHYNPSNVFIGTSLGVVLKSEDRGESWSPVKKINDRISGLYLSPHDSRIMLVTTERRGTFRTRDGGFSWTNLEDNMEDFDDSRDVRDLFMPESDKGWIFLVTEYGLLKSEDFGDTWSEIELLTPEDEAVINSITMNPQDPDEIYYVTNNTFYRSLNGGESWSTQALPTSRPGQSLLINPEKPNIIYLGIGASPDSSIFGR